MPPVATSLHGALLELLGGGLLLYSCESDGFMISCNMEMLKHYAHVLQNTSRRSFQLFVFHCSNNGLK